MPVVTLAAAVCSLAMTQTPSPAPAPAPLRATWAPEGPPPTLRRPVEETLHGVAFVDEYRWLEGDLSDAKAYGKITPEVAEWTDAQNAYTRAVLDNIPGRWALEQRLRTLMEMGSVSAPVMRGARYFYTRRDGAMKQPRLHVRESHDGESRVLVDPVAIDPTGLTAMGGFDPSQDGSLLAYTVFKAGDENTTVRVLNVKTGEHLADEIPGKADVIQWLPDNSGFYYTNLENVKDPYSRQIMLHRLGEPVEKDKRVFRQFTREQNEKLATTWGPGASVSRDGRWMALMYWTSTRSNDLWIVDLEQWAKTGELVKRPVSVGADARFFGAVETIDGKPTLLMMTDLDAPRMRVVAVDLALSDLTQGARGPEGAPAWREIIPQSPVGERGGVLKEFGIAEGLIAAEFEENATSRVRLFSMTGEPRGELRLPGLGSAGIRVERDRTEAFVSYTSFNSPNTIFRVDLARPEAEPAVWARPDAPVDPSLVVVEQQWFESKDGTRVPMFIVHKPGITLDGSNPVLMTGYGGFNISQTPGFSPTLFTWFEAGGVFVSVNLRGGGEFGSTWHQAGIRENKQNSFDDFIAAAEWLIAKGYTRPERLAAVGGSNGGLLMGALLTQRPDLFRAIVCAVPLLDMLRYERFLMARFWAPEYGTAESPAEFAWLKEYSPYQRVQAGVNYPAVLFTAGENDTRVHPMHARKMAAAVQAATNADPRERPVLLWVDRDAGHGAGKPLNLRVRDAADMRSFIMWQLGVPLSTGKGE
jgi:prolyl oligopeptidase